MTNIEKYNNIFISAFSVEETDLNETFTILDVAKWDSVAHMALIANLEEAFDVMFETDDIIGFGSYLHGIEILKGYGIEF